MIRDGKLRKIIRTSKEALRVRKLAITPSCYACPVNNFTRETGVTCRNMWVRTDLCIPTCVLKPMKSIGLYIEEKSKTMELLTKKEKENGKEMDT